MESMQDPQKILLVGTERNCRSIGYVLDFKDYELIEKLTTENYVQYQDYQIYVCELKRKSKKLIDCKLLKSIKGIQYLDDICHKIDKEWLQAKKNNIKSNQPKCVKQSLMKRIVYVMKYPLRVIWHGVLRFRFCLSNLSVNKKARPVRYSKYSKINEYYQHLLCGFSPSQLLLYVLRAPINNYRNCTRIENNLEIDDKGMVKGCAGCSIPFGNLVNDVELTEIYNGVYARIVKLSSLNGSYCLCGSPNVWCIGYGVSDNSKEWVTLKTPKRIIVNFDRSCNLACKSCRKKFYVMDDAAKKRTSLITEKLLRSGYLEKIKGITIAAMGEVFYSSYYRQLLTAKKMRNKITIKSNGILFNKDNWQLVVSNNIKGIDVDISVDAATAETYRRLRGADFNILTKNLEMLSELRRENKIEKMTLNFVVQRENFIEMPDFVRFGEKLGVDRINFQRMYDWGVMPAKEYRYKCMVKENKYLDYELWKVLQDPIFKNPIVDLRILQRYIDASEKKYRKRYEREQRIMKDKE